MEQSEKDLESTSYILREIKGEIAMTTRMEAMKKNQLESLGRKTMKFEIK